MILPGHIAAGYLAAHYAKLDERVALVAAVFPDVVDKTGRYILRLTPNGRVPAHALLSFLATIVLAWLIFRRKGLVVAWAAGYASHLCMDILTDAISYGSSFDYLLWPFRAAQASRYHTLFGSVMDYVILIFVLEALVTAWGVVIFLKTRRDMAGRRALEAGNGDPASS